MPVELQIPDIVWRRYAAYQDICKTEINSTIPGRTTEQNGPSGPADKANDTVPGSIFVAAGACGCSSPSLLLPHAPAGPARAK